MNENTKNENIIETNLNDAVVINEEENNISKDIKENKNIENKENKEKLYFDLKSYEEAYRVATLLSKCNFINKVYHNNPANCAMIILRGLSLGLDPSVSLFEISIINGKPVLSATLMKGVAQSKGLVEDLQYIFEGNEKNGDLKCICKVKRKNCNYYEIGEFSIEDAKKAKLLNKDNWNSYLRTMLEHRATAFAFRKAFADLFCGLYIQDEMENIKQEEQNEPQENKQQKSMEDLRNENLQQQYNNY